MPGNGHGEKMTRKREQALAALLSEPTLAAAASKAGISERTLRDWLAQPDFLSAYRDARRQVVESAIARLQRGADKAVEALERNLDADKPADLTHTMAHPLSEAPAGSERANTGQRLPPGNLTRYIPRWCCTERTRAYGRHVFGQGIEDAVPALPLTFAEGGCLG